MRCIKIVENSLWSRCLSCSSPGPSNGPPAEMQSGSTFSIWPQSHQPVWPLVFSGACCFLLSGWVLHLSWRTAWMSEDLNSNNSNSKVVDWGKIWGGRGNLRQGKVSRQQSQGSICAEVSGTVSKLPQLLAKVQVTFKLLEFDLQAASAFWLAPEFRRGEWKCA